jgi:hypothetical protein
MVYYVTIEAHLLEGTSYVLQLCELHNTWRPDIKRSSGSAGSDLVPTKLDWAYIRGKLPQYYRIYPNTAAPRDSIGHPRSPPHSVEGYGCRTVRTEVPSTAYIYSSLATVGMDQPRAHFRMILTINSDRREVHTPCMIVCIPACNYASRSSSLWTTAFLSRVFQTTPVSHFFLPNSSGRTRPWGLLSL